MQTFNVMITEQLQRNVEVEADSIEEALVKVKDSYSDSKIILDSEDYTNTFFQCEESITTIFDD